MCRTACRPGPRARRRYLNRDEKIALLERYADELENELTGVRERIEELEDDG